MSSSFTLPVDWLSELERLWIVNDMGNDVFSLSEIVLADGGERGEPEGRFIDVRHYAYNVILYVTMERE